MKSLMKIASSYVGENMDLFPAEFIRDLPGSVLESILPYMSAYWLHTLHHTLVSTGVRCDWLWNIHIRQRWGFGVQSTLNVFQETMDTDPRNVYLLKHFHDLLNYCTLSINTRDPHSLFMCPVQRLDHRETNEPPRVMAVPCLPSSSPISMFISARHRDGGTVGPMAFHLDQLLQFSVCAHTLRVVGSQCGWIAECAPLIDKLLKVTERLQLVTLTDTYYQGIQALVVMLMKHGKLSKVVLSTVKLSEPYLLDLLYICSGKLSHCGTHDHNLPQFKTGMCTECVRVNTVSDTKQSCEEDAVLVHDIEVLDRTENAWLYQDYPGPSTSFGNSDDDQRLRCSRNIEPLLCDVGYNSDASSSVIDIPEGLLDTPDLDLYDEAVTPVLARKTDSLENLVLAQPVKPCSVLNPPSLFKCTQCHSTSYCQLSYQSGIHMDDSSPASSETLNKATCDLSVDIKTKGRKVGTIDQNCDIQDNESVSRDDDDASCSTCKQCHQVKDSTGDGNQVQFGCQGDQTQCVPHVIKGLESFALLSTASRYDISSVLVQVLPGWLSLTKFGVFDVDLKTEELTKQLMEKVHCRQLSHLVLDDITVHASFFQKFLDTLHTHYRYEDENGAALELLDLQACNKPIEVDRPLLPGVLLRGVKKLDLSMNTLSESGFAALLILIKNDLALIHLKLNGCFLQEEQVLQLLQCLAGNTGMEVVSLSGNRVIEESVEKALIQFIDKCVSLKSLILNYSRLRSSFVSSDAFITTVRDHPSLQELSIKNNHLESGALDFLKAISCCPQRPALRSLNIGYNWIKGQDLIEAGQEMRAYQRLHFPYTRPVLDFLSLSGNRLLHSFQQQLRKEYKGLITNLEANSIDFSRPYAEHVGQM